MRATESGFVASRVVTTNDFEMSLQSANRSMRRLSSNEFTRPRGGLTLPHAPHGVRPTRMSCSNGTPITIFMARNADDFAACFPDLGNMFENFRAGYAIECIVGKVELRHVTGKQWQCPDNRRKGFSRSSAVTEAKCSVSSLERKPSLAPISSAVLRPLGRTRSKSAVRAFSSSDVRFLKIGHFLR